LYPPSWLRSSGKNLLLLSFMIPLTHSSLSFAQSLPLSLLYSLLSRRYMESVSVATKYSQANNYEIRPNQELIALGACACVCERPHECVCVRVCMTCVCLFALALACSQRESDRTHTHGCCQLGRFYLRVLPHHWRTISHSRKREQPQAWLPLSPACSSC
jgi:hypothetical protein